MWPKSFAALFGGCILSITLVLNIKFMMPFSLDIQFFTGMLLIFPIWTAIMVWCYSCKNGKQAWVRCGILSAPSAVINVFYIWVNNGVPFIYS